ncbi:amidohydrolase family protein [Bifidobacterium saguinibicoloris]|uniref:amidohydrolase family protein n=1 Tax=Bifidobacterium saguinibicoloris TaxID=2834433 RepID=UPI001C594887|nr:amidohydrolase family protein [Bifidobacterium saguinibicoloris]MBW3081262.1 amidohydrolase family protein [Bifidobacterium saguinibicoloris]
MTLGEDYQRPVPGRMYTIIPETPEHEAAPRPFIDTHVHLMHTDLYSWFNPSKALTFEGPWDPLFQAGDYVASDLLDEVHGSTIGVVGAVHVQANADDPVAEIADVERQSEETGLPVMIVGGGDLSSPDFAETLERELDHPHLRGVRQNLNMHPHPLYRYVDMAYMDDPEWLNGLDLLAGHDLSFDMQLYPTQFARACEVIDAHPDTLFIIDHMGMWADRDPAGWRLWKNGLYELGKRDNCVIKISGQPSMDHYWTIESIKPGIYTTLDAFGIDKTMFASNFPVDKLHCSYLDLVHAYARCVETLSPGEQDMLFVGNAKRYYRF